MRTRRRLLHLVGVLVLGALVVSGFPLISKARPAADANMSTVSRTVSVAPTLARDFRPAKAITAAQHDALVKKQQDLRDAMAAGEQPAAGPTGPTQASAAPSQAVDKPADTEFHGSPGTFVFGRNNRNPQANCTTDCSTLAEPAAANEGPHVFYSGNFRHAESSTNGGVSYTNVGFPAGPADAPTACCDTDVIYDHSRGVTFYSMLYVNGALNNGVIRVFVRRNIPSATNCSYTIDPGGTANNVLPDYPHLGLSNNFLYFNANLIRGGTVWGGAMMERLNLDQLADCVTASGQVVTLSSGIGQRILVPGHGARDVMYFSWPENSSTWRIFSWADSSASVSSVLRSVSSMPFGNPDCRGGSLNNDWTGPNAASIVGFNVRTAIGGGKVAVFAPTAADAAHTQGHIHGAVFRQSDLALLQQPVIFNNSYCFGIPMVGANDRGDLGLSLAFGGRAGGGGAAAQGGVTMIDEFSPGPGGFTIFGVASGTHNRPDQRYGDYFTVRRNAPCGEFFDATSYGLLNGTGVANVNARYVEFGRNRDAQCYLAWQNAVPAT